MLLYLALRGIDWHDVANTARRGHLDRFVPALLVLSGSYFLRSLRWRILLSAERRIPVLQVFWANMTGYLGNCFLPARAGEVIRSAFIARCAAIGISFVLATALTERMVDALALALIGALASFGTSGLPAWLTGAVRAALVVGTLALAILGIASRSERLLRGALRRIALPARVQASIDNVLRSFLLGLRALQHRRRALPFVGLTAIIWLADATSAMIMAWAMNFSLTLPQALLLLVTLGLASAAPSTPGYVGIYQFVAVTVLMPFGLTRDQAIVYIVAVQAEIYCITLFWGLLGLWQLRNGTTLPRNDSAGACDVA